MDDKTLYGTLGEISVIKRLISEGIEVYTSFNGKGSVNIIGYYKEFNLLLRIQVISCKQETPTSYKVEIRKIRSNKTENSIHSFDKDSQDIIAIYLVDLDKVLFVGSDRVTTKSQITVLKDTIEVMQKVTALESIK